MQLNELKKSMSTLEQVLAKTNTDIKINVSAYIYLYRKLKSINIAVLSPKQLFSKTATIKLLTLAGEIFIGMCLVSFFALLLPSVWTFHRIGFWIMTIGLILGIVYSIFHYWPQYVKLFRDLNSIKE